MDVHELLRSWPGVSALSAEALLSHPAWRMPVGYADDVLSVVVEASGPLRPDELLLAVTLDEVDNVLGISDSSRYPDLHRLWARRAELPEALLIALVEKEAGPLLQTVEELTKRELRLVGLAGSANAGDGATRRSFRLESSDGASGFSLRVPAEVVTSIGVLDNLDTSHESIQSLTRPARAEYAVIDAAPDVVSALKTGDFLLAEQETEASWQTELPDDSSLRLRDEAEEIFTFSQFASEDLPPVPPPSALAVFCHGCKVATAQTARIGDVFGYCILQTA